MGKRSAPTDDTAKPIPYDPDFKGPLKRRSCTDVICFMLFIIFIGCWIGIALYAFTSGNPNILLVPKDSNGLRCGLDEVVKDKPYLFFFDLTKCFGPLVPFTGCPTPQVCVEECPTEFFLDKFNTTGKLICKYGVTPTPAEEEQFIKDKKCAQYYLPSTPFENRCVPRIDLGLFDTLAKNLRVDTNVIVSGIKNLKALTQAEQVGQNVVDDLIRSWWQILIGVAIAVLICFIYILMLRWLAAPMVWLSLVGVLVLLIAGLYFSVTKYMEIKDRSSEPDVETNNLFEAYAANSDTWLVLLIIFSIILAIVVLMLIFLRKRILLAIALVKEGSKAVGSVFSVLFFPIFPWVLQIGVVVFGICCALYLATTGKASYKIRGFVEGCPCPVKNNDPCEPANFSAMPCMQDATQNCINLTCKFITMENPPLYPYLQAINAVGLIWGSFFVSALGQMILASVFATWYWTFNKRNVPFFGVLVATGRTFRYHIGTLAFGSLIITICRIIRIGLEYIDRKVKKYDNGFAKAVLCCCKCFFWCLEKFLKFINRNAYIMCAIHGKNFCTSAKDAFMLLMRNIVRVFVLDKVTDFLFFLGKLFITIGVGALCYLFFATDLTGFDNSGLNYNIVPVVVIMIITFFIATMFFNVYSMAVDTLFLCFLEDCERNDGSSEKPYYMSKNLMKIFGKKNKKD